MLEVGLVAWYVFVVEVGESSASSNGTQTGSLPRFTNFDNGYSWRKIIFALYIKRKVFLK